MEPTNCCAEMKISWDAEKKHEHIKKGKEAAWMFACGPAFIIKK